jgi:putative FmdB family regulatory protein
MMKVKIIMPHYDYRCINCHYQEEIFQKMNEEVLKKCPSCHQESFQRQFSGGTGLHFKGSGFYITDYPSSSTSCCPCGKNSSCSSKESN